MRRWLPALFTLLTLAAAAGAAGPLKRGDRVLFLGDDLTQQMFYSRAAATCLLSLQPADDLRFINGGRDGSTTAEAMDWSGDLIEQTRATVVVICFGLNDVVVHEAEQYELELSNLVASVRRHPTVRQVVVLSPPALPKQTGPKLEAFADVAERVAQTEGVAYVDIYHPMRRLYDSAGGELKDRLSLGPRLPGEPMHMVIASCLLAAMGVSDNHVEATNWSPLTPELMGRVRPHLAWADTEAPPVAEAAASRRLYLTLTRCDELFFRLWRLEGGSDEALKRQWQEAWVQAAQQAAGFGMTRED